MEALLAFAAALLTSGSPACSWRWRERRQPQFAAWAAGLAAFAAASAALAWGAASGWSDPVFRAYYLFGGLLTAALLGVGSLLLAGRRWAAPLGLLYAGLAVGMAVAVPLTSPVSGDSIPEAQAHLDFVPARLLAVLGNSAGTIAVVAVALLTIRRRPSGTASSSREWSWPPQAAASRGSGSPRPRGSSPLQPCSSTRGSSGPVVAGRFDSAPRRIRLPRTDRGGEMPVGASRGIRLCRQERSAWVRGRVATVGRGPPRRRVSASVFDFWRY